MQNLRMYAVTLRSLSGRQQGIQGGHAIVRYGREHDGAAYQQWADKDETIILLEAGTVHDLEQAGRELMENGIPIAVFREPDLGGIVTAIAFLADEKMYDSKKYTDEDILDEDNLRIARFRSIKKRFPLASS